MGETHAHLAMSLLGGGGEASGENNTLTANKGDKCNSKTEL